MQHDLSVLRVYLSSPVLATAIRPRETSSAQRSAQASVDSQVPTEGFRRVAPFITSTLQSTYLLTPYCFRFLLSIRTLCDTLAVVYVACHVFS